MGQKTGTSPRLGRPPLPPGEVRSKRIVTFVTEAELTRLAELAEADGHTLSTACHRILLDYLDRAPRS